MITILIVDDDEALGNALHEELSEVGYTVFYVSSAEEAIQFISQNTIDLLLLDLKMPGKDGFFVLNYIKETGCRFKVIVLTAYADVKSAIHAAKLGADDFISKPYDFEELLITIRKVSSTDLANEN